MVSIYTHPNPKLNYLAHAIARVMVGMLWLSVVAQLFLVALLSAPVMLFSALLTAILSAPLLMFLYATPPIQLTQSGLKICPPYGKSQFIPWAAIHEIRDYPLLPTPDQEAERRIWVGRKHYQPARGKLLLVVGLPWPYRVMSFFAGVYPSPAIAITNRTHMNYDQLVKVIYQYTDQKDG